MKHVARNKWFMVHSVNDTFKEGAVKPLKINSYKLSSYILICPLALILCALLYLITYTLSCRTDLAPSSYFKLSSCTEYIKMFNPSSVSGLSKPMRTCVPSQRSVWWSLSSVRLRILIPARTFSPGESLQNSNSMLSLSIMMYCPLGSFLLFTTDNPSLHSKICHFFPPGFSLTSRALRSQTTAWWTSSLLVRTFTLWQKQTSSLK